jgi:hypothetical protein
MYTNQIKMTGESELVRMSDVRTVNKVFMGKPDGRRKAEDQF